MNKLCRTISVRGIWIKTINQKHNKQGKKYQFPFAPTVGISFDLLVYFASPHFKKQIIQGQKKHCNNRQPGNLDTCTPHCVQINLSA